MRTTNRNIDYLRKVLEQVNNGLPKLTFHVVYNSDTDFINDVKEGRLGENAWGDLSLMLRQQSNLAIKLYNHKNHSLIKTIQSTVEF